MKTKNVFVLLSAAWALSGCVSWLKSEKLSEDGDEKGIRYSLPQPFLLVTPKPDGVVDVEVWMLPDSGKTYVIRQPSFIATHSLNVERENGLLLKSIEFNMDTAAVPAKAAEGYGEMKKTEIETEAAAAKTAAEKSAAAKKRVEDAELAVAKAQAIVDFLAAKPLPHDALTAAELLKAQIALQQAQTELEAAADAATAMGVEGFNLAKPGGGANSAPTAYGPMLFRIDQAYNKTTKKYTVALAAASFDAAGSPQRAFETSTVALPPAEQPPAFAFDPSGFMLEKNKYQFQVTTTVAVKAYDKATSSISETSNPGSPVARPEKPDLVWSANGRTLTVGVPTSLPPGTYTFDLPLKIGSGTAFESKELKVVRQ